MEGTVGCVEFVRSMPVIVVPQVWLRSSGVRDRAAEGARGASVTRSAPVATRRVESTPDLRKRPESSRRAVSNGPILTSRQQAEGARPPLSRSQKVRHREAPPGRTVPA
ncbi:hypothetical protein GCM10010497_49700 [Streptomyces cinereoruber]|uniref:Uncharacterized protein n=1 Tax=Streptomyces cinereoruber TaxID=67260 RepID=A0AAV4KMQ2_9ACTN|nr:hypothetical protein GCM10010497_49700 [Streptomyces cinereoruber]